MKVGPIGILFSLLIFLAVVLSTGWWLELQETQADMQRMRMDHAAQMDARNQAFARAYASLQVVRQLNRYYQGCLTGNPWGVDVEDFSHDLAQMREVLDDIEKHGGLYNGQKQRKRR